MSDITDCGTWFLDHVFTAIKNKKELNADFDRFITAYYFETVNNQSLLNAVDIPSVENSLENMPALAALLNQLETGAASAILFAGESPANEKIQKFFRETVALPQAEKDKGHKTTMLYSMAYILTRITFLQKISSLNDSSLLKRIRLEQRITNLSARLESMRKTLITLDAVKGVAFPVEEKNALNVK
jgi:hypothetical protein